MHFASWELVEGRELEDLCFNNNTWVDDITLFAWNVDCNKDMYGCLVWSKKSCVKNLINVFIFNSIHYLILSNDQSTSYCSWIAQIWFWRNPVLNSPTDIVCIKPAILVFHWSLFFLSHFSGYEKIWWRQ